MKGKIELIDKLGSNDTKNIVMLTCASKDVLIKVSYQRLHILNNKEILNGLKGGIKMQKRESLLKYQSCIYNMQRKSDVNHRGMKMRWINTF